MCFHDALPKTPLPPIKRVARHRPEPGPKRAKGTSDVVATPCGSAAVDGSPPLTISPREEAYQDPTPYPSTPFQPTTTTGRCSTKRLAETIASTDHWALKVTQPIIYT